MVTWEPGQRVIVTRPRDRRGSAPSWSEDRPHRFTGTVMVVDTGPFTRHWVRVRIDEEFRQRFYNNIEWYCADEWLQPEGGPW